MASKGSKTQVVDLDDDVSFGITQFLDQLTIAMYVNDSEITLTKNISHKTPISEQILFLKNAASLPNLRHFISFFRKTPL